MRAAIRFILGFPLPRPVAMRPEYPRLRFRVARRMQTLQKVEDTWCGMLCECSSRIRYNPESIQRVVVQTASHTNRNRDGNLYVRYLYWNDDRWDWGNNWLDNDWSGYDPA